MLVALHRPAELELHLRAALTNGVTPAEIKEVLLHARFTACACGESAFAIAKRVLGEAGDADRPQPVRGDSSAAESTPTRKNL